MQQHVIARDVLTHDVASSSYEEWLRRIRRGGASWGAAGQALALPRSPKCAVPGGFLDCAPLQNIGGGLKEVGRESNVVYRSSPSSAALRAVPEPVVRVRITCCSEGGPGAQLRTAPNCAQGAARLRTATAPARRRGKRATLKETDP